ncbi:hypothetical protein F4775DRAFT_578318 [Biscogniauxia sp. FL1348]|nr:hypothetical protein F4775DRAFT_578318 [Biscogniauxia sp. FL1348]
MLRTASGMLPTNLAGERQSRKPIQYLYVMLEGRGKLISAHAGFIQAVYYLQPRWRYRANVLDEMNYRNNRAWNHHRGYQYVDFSLFQLFIGSILLISPREPLDHEPDSTGWETPKPAHVLVGNGEESNHDDSWLHCSPPCAQARGEGGEWPRESHEASSTMGLLARRFPFFRLLADRQTRLCAHLPPKAPGKPDTPQSTSSTLPPGRGRR